jgi:hypothetical protein
MKKKDRKIPELLISISNPVSAIAIAIIWPLPSRELGLWILSRFRISADTLLNKHNGLCGLTSFT